MSRGSADFKTMEFDGGIVTNAYEGNIETKLWINETLHGNVKEYPTGLQKEHVPWEGVGRKQTAKPNKKILKRRFKSPSGWKSKPTRLARTIDRLSPHKGKLAALGLASAIGATAYGMHHDKKHATKGFHGIAGEDLNACFD